MLVFVAEIGDVTRFSAARQLCCWAGLNPRHHQSDTTVRRGPITKQVPAWCVGGHRSHQPDHGGSWLQVDYHRIADRRGRNVARVAAARKILTLVYYGLRDGEIRCLAETAEPARTQPACVLAIMS